MKSDTSNCFLGLISMFLGTNFGNGVEESIKNFEVLFLVMYALKNQSSKFCNVLSVYDFDLVGTNPNSQFFPLVVSIFQISD